MARILITNNGTHSSEQWAVTSAESIFDITPSVAGDRLLSARKLQTKIAEALMSVYDQAQEDEKQKLAGDPEYILSQHDVTSYVGDAIAQVQEAASGSPWEAHFQKPEVVVAAKEVLGNHLASSHHVERLWHASTNRNSKHAHTYLAHFSGGPTPQA